MAEPPAPSNRKGPRQTKIRSRPIDVTKGIALLPTTEGIDANQQLSTVIVNEKVQSSLHGKGNLNGKAGAGAPGNDQNKISQNNEDQPIPSGGNTQISGSGAISVAGVASANRESALLNKQKKEIPVPPIFEIKNYSARFYYSVFTPSQHYIKSHLNTSAGLTTCPDVYDLLQDDITWLNNYNEINKRIQLSEENMAKLMTLYEKDAGRITLRGAETLSPEEKIDVTRDYPLSQASQRAASLLQLRGKAVEEVYKYWMDKRRRLGKSLLAFYVEPPARTDPSPHVAFRPRVDSRRISRRNPRKDDTSAYQKIDRLSKDFVRLLDIIDIMQMREHIKREIVINSSHLFDSKLTSHPNYQKLVSYIDKNNAAIISSLTNQSNIINNVPVPSPLSSLLSTSLPAPNSLPSLVINQNDARKRADELRVQSRKRDQTALNQPSVNNQNSQRNSSRANQRAQASASANADSNAERASSGTVMPPPRSRPRLEGSNATASRRSSVAEDSDSSSANNQQDDSEEESTTPTAGPVIDVEDEIFLLELQEHTRKANERNALIQSFVDQGLPPPIIEPKVIKSFSHEYVDDFFGRARARWGRCGRLWVERLIYDPEALNKQLLLTPDLVNDQALEPLDRKILLQTNIESLDKQLSQFDELLQINSQPDNDNEKVVESGLFDNESIASMNELDDPASNVPSNESDMNLDENNPSGSIPSNSSTSSIAPLAHHDIHSASRDYLKSVMYGNDYENYSMNQATPGQWAVQVQQAGKDELGLLTLPDDEDENYKKFKKKDLFPSGLFQPSPIAFHLRVRVEPTQTPQTNYFFNLPPFNNLTNTTTNSSATNNNPSNINNNNNNTSATAPTSTITPPTTVSTSSAATNNSTSTVISNNMTLVNSTLNLSSNATANVPLRY